MTMGYRLRSGSARRALASISAAALLTSLLAVPAFAEHRENTEVLEADTAIGAALEWSEFTFATAETVLIGRDDVFADNLASGVLQGTDAPLLLTDSDALHADVAAEIDRLGADSAIILGGEAAISEDVANELEDLGLAVTRLGGATRVETSVDIAQAVDGVNSIIVARAFGTPGGDETQAFADSLAAGGWAAESGMPVLLTTTDELHDAVADYVEDAGIDSAFIVGGTSAVSAAAESDLEALGVDVTRVSGATRFETAVAIAEARGFDSAADADEVILTEGQQANAWAGGFPAAAYSAINDAPIVLANGDDIPEPTEDFLNGTADTASLLAHGSAHLVCGPLLEAAACDAAAEILGFEEEPHTNQTYTVAPSERAVNTVSVNNGTNNNRGTRQYTVNTGSATQVDIQLFPAANVKVDADGVVTFVDTNSDNIADPGAPVGFISVVNGAGTSGTRVDDVTPVNGQVTFSVNSLDAGSVIPVVFTDNQPATTGDDSLNLTAASPANANPKTPAEAFGIAGEKTWVPTEHAGGQIGTGMGVDVTMVDKAGDFFTGCNITTDNAHPTADVVDNTNCRTFNYDANDTFQLNGVPVTMATFEQNLSTGDDVTGTYAPDPAAVSTFNLEDEAPAAPPGAITAAAVDGSSSSVRVTWTGVTGADTYNVYRIADTDNTENGTCPVPSSTFSGWTRVATVTAPTATYTDTGLAPNTSYCYFVTTVDDGDESGASNRDDAKTPAADASVRPLITDARLSNDANLQGVADAGDTWKIVFNKTMDSAAVIAGGRLILTDPQNDQVDVTCGGNVTCTFNAGDETVGGATHASSRVLTVLINNTTGWTDVTPADGFQYPLTINTANDQVRDTQGNVVNIPESTDKTVETEA